MKIENINKKINKVHPEVSLLRISHFLHHIKENTLLIKTNKREMLKQVQHGSSLITTTQKAFTLIELLVVVLIIGILAAVALPQYQKAVIRSKVVGALPNLKYLENQIEIYHLANGEYPPDNLKTVMDLDIPGCGGGISGRYACKNYGLDYEGFAPDNPYIRLCFPDCSEGTTREVLLQVFLKTKEKTCSSRITGFCNSLKNIWQN